VCGFLRYARLSMNQSRNPLIRRCEERSDVAIKGRCLVCWGCVPGLPRRPPLSRRAPRNDDWVVQVRVQFSAGTVSRVAREGLDGGG